MADGHLGKCKACTKKDVKERYCNPKKREEIRKYERVRSARPERKAKKLEYQRRARKKFKGKFRARARINNGLINGKVKKESCVKCGKNAEAHHPDYRKPLSVVWLCFTHHRETHKKP